MSYDFEREMGIEERLEAQGNPPRREDLPAFPKPSQAEGHVHLTKKEKRIVTLELYYEQHGICACGCGFGMSLAPGLFDSVELDHIQPQPMGHKKNDARSNLRAVRHICNSRKGSRRNYDGGAEGKR